MPRPLSVTSILHGVGEYIPLRSLFVFNWLRILTLTTENILRTFCYWRELLQIQTTKTSSSYHGATRIGSKVTLGQAVLRLRLLTDGTKSPRARLLQRTKQWRCTVRSW